MQIVSKNKIKKEILCIMGNKINNLILSVSKYIVHRNTDKLVKRVLAVASFETIKNVPPKSNKDVLFVTPFMFKHGGGLTSVLRIAQRLEKKGMNVCFSSPVSNDIKTMEHNAQINLKSYNCKYIEWEKALKKNYDFVISVEDVMVYYARKISGYQIYFVQDFEPYFHPVGDRYYLSKKAYELGEDIISLGNWNIKEIKRNLNLNKIGNMYSIEFPFESSEYPLIKRDFKLYPQKKEINLAVYTKREAKRLPGIIMNMLENAKNELKKENININIYYFGLHKVEKLSSGTNLGRIDKSQIRELYEKCDFGLVASMTNISLVPYEMIGSGLPVIEFLDGSYSSFLGKDTSILLESFDYKEMVQKLLFYKNNPEKLHSLCINARERISNLSWDKTGEEFYNILNNISND